jgi:hypothetical protein
MKVEVLDPIETYGISSLAIIGGCDTPVSWEVALGILLGEVILRGQDDEWGMAQLRALTPWITVAHLRLLGWASFALLRPSEVVTTMPAEMMPIINPVSSKL